VKGSALSGERLERGVALGMLLAVFAAAGLEGGVVPMYGGVVYAVAVAFGLAWIVLRGVDPLPRLAKVGVALFAVVVLYQALAVPEGVREILAPGQAAWIDRVAPESSAALDPWLSAVATYDVMAAVGAAGDWTYDLLAGSSATTWRQGAIDPEAWRWTLGQLLAMGVVWLVGAGLGRSPAATRTVLVGLLLFCVFEAVFGLANRNGPSTGIGVKQYYMGSATGTFVNRGHFAALLVLGVGAAWGLAAGLFPLLPEEVRKHMARKRRSSQPPSVFEASGDRIPRLALLGFLVAVLLVAIVASQSRGPVLGLAVAGLVVGAGMAWRRKETFHLGIAVAVPIAGGVLALLAFGIGGAFGRFRGLLSGGDASVLSRLDVWRDSVPAFLDAPVFGAGLGGWQLAHALHETPDHLYTFSNAHNELVEIVVEMGVVGTLAYALVGIAIVRGLVRALRDVPHDEGTAAGVGALVGVLAVLVQSLGDFPLHIPGVALPWALMAGLAQGALTNPEKAGAKGPPLVVGLVAIGLCGAAALADSGFVGSRDDRLAERGSLWNEPDRAKGTLASIRAWRDTTRAAVDRAPLDPWSHAAMAEAEAILAREAWRVDGARPVGESPEDHALQADLAVTRAHTLRPRDPRLALTLAKSLVLLAQRASTPDAFEARAVNLLADAVARDPWRADEAFAIADRLSDDALAKVAASATSASQAPRARARVAYAHGKALERRGRGEAAAAAHAVAITADSAYGPALFAAGVLARNRGETEAGDELLRRFLTADERGTGMEGWALVLLGELDTAEARLRRAVQQSPTNRWAWEGLAEIAKRQADVEDERAALKKILALDPNHRPAKGRMVVLDAAKK
jgi:O-antigen ligase/tetratricopeptide (TPR) repeat protein